MNEIKLPEQAAKRVLYEIEEIHKGLADADTGSFASDDAVDAIFVKYDLDETD